MKDKEYADENDRCEAIMRANWEVASDHSHYLAQPCFAVLADTVAAHGVSAASDWVSMLSPVPDRDVMSSPRTPRCQMLPGM